MEEKIAALEQAFSDYRHALEQYERKRKPTDGLLGFGHSIKDEPCHEILDERVKQIVDEMCGAQPSSEDAERAVRMLLLRKDTQAWPLAAQWMLRAIERHAIPLVPFLSQQTAITLFREYGNRYRPWDRLPAQKEVYRALRARA